MTSWIDISLPLGPGTPVFPGDPPIELDTDVAPVEAPYRLSRLVLGTHSGTHLDAPAHFIRGGAPMSAIGPERLNGPAWVVKLTEAIAIEPEALAAAWPDAPVERVLLSTPNSARWGTPEAGGVYQALSPAAAAWLVERGVMLVGIDALSIEADTDGTFPVHMALLGAGVVILEGIDLRGVEPGLYELVCLPLRLEAPDGAPARALLRRG